MADTELIALFLLTLLSIGSVWYYQPAPLADLAFAAGVSGILMAGALLLLSFRRIGDFFHTTSPPGMDATALYLFLALFGFFLAQLSWLYQPMPVPRGSFPIYDALVLALQLPFLFLAFRNSVLRLAPGYKAGTEDYIAAALGGLTVAAMLYYLLPDYTGMSLYSQAIRYAHFAASAVLLGWLVSLLLAPIRMQLTQPLATFAAGAAVLLVADLLLLYLDSIGSFIHGHLVYTALLYGGEFITGMGLVTLKLLKE